MPNSDIGGLIDAANDETKKLGFFMDRLCFDGGGSGDLKMSKESI